MINADKLAISSLSGQGNKGEMIGREMVSKC